MKKFSSTTKVNYRHSSRKSILTRWVLGASGVILFGVIFPTLISWVSSAVMYPYHATAHWLRTSEEMLPLYLRNRSSLIAEVEELKKQAALNTGTDLSIRRLTDENIQLRGLLNDMNTEERRIARVIARPNELPYDLLQIDKGSESGVVVGAPVYTGVDTVVGVVTETASTYAFVSLFTAPSYEATAFISDINMFAPIEGVGGGVARVRLPQGITLREGQLVILPGISSAVYGQVERVESEPTEPEQYGYVVPPLGVNNLRYVSIGLAPISIKSDVEINESVKRFIRDTLSVSTTTYSYATTSDEVATSSEESLTP